MLPILGLHSSWYNAVPIWMGGARAMCSTHFGSHVNSPGELTIQLLAKLSTNCGTHSCRSGSGSVTCDGIRVETDSSKERIMARDIDYAAIAVNRAIVEKFGRSNDLQKLTLTAGEKTIAVCDGECTVEGTRDNLLAALRRAETYADFWQLAQPAA
jgi:hypothetical protein